MIKPTRSPVQAWVSMPQHCQQIAARHKNNLALAIKGNDACQYYHFLFINSKISQLAAYMRDSGVKPHHRVALHLDKGLEAYVAIFAIWRLNAVYCPMPTTLNTIDFNLRFDDCQPHFMISMPTHIESHGDFDWKCTTILDASILAKTCEPTLNFEQKPIEPSDPAYIIFTSGTTGRPKGVIIPHEALLSRYESHQRLMRLTPKDTVLQYADFRVDVSLMEIWLAWATGACLCVPTGNINTLVHEFPVICQELAITTIILAPSMLELFVKDNEFIDASHAEAFQLLHHIVSATEAATESTLTAWRLAGTTTPRRIYNGYGPTETVVGLSLCEYIEGPINLGSHQDHFEGVTLYVYRDGQLHQNGSGEICAHGRGFSLGYWSNGRDDKMKTQDAFPTLPIDKEGQAIPVYRTGDQGHFNQVGQLFFAGRVEGDQQAKINGSRVELGNIIINLKSHPMILDATAFIQGKTVVAIIQVAQPHTITRQVIRKQFGERGDYNSAFMPKSIRETATPFKKIRPTIDNSHLIKVDDNPIHEPRNKIEEALRSIWADLLNYEDPISIDHDFYDLGGYSLLVSQMLMVIEQTFKVSINLSSLASMSIRIVAEEIGLLQIFQKCTHPTADNPNIQPSDHVFVFFPPLAGNATLKYKHICDRRPLDTPSYNTLLIKHPLQCPLLTENEIDYYKSLLPLSIEREAAYLASSIQHHYKHGNLHYIGWSFGGLMAWVASRYMKPDRVKSLHLLDSQAPGEILKLSRKEHHARIRQIIAMLFREFSCPELALTDHSKHNHQTCINNTFSDALKAASEITDDTKLTDMLLTAQHHLSATLNYKPDPTVSSMPVYLYRAEPSQDKAPDECKPHSWESFTKNLSEYTIKNSDHFDLTDQDDFVSLFFANLSHELSKVINAEHMRALSTENFKALCAPRTQRIVDTFPFTLHGEGGLHHGTLLTMCIDELYCDPSLASIGLRFHPRFNRKLISAQIQTIIRSRYGKIARRSFPFTIQLNSIEHQGPISSIDAIESQIPHFRAIQMLLDLNQVIIIVTHLSDAHVINKTVIDWLNGHHAQYILLSEHHERSLHPELIQKEQTYEITCSGADEKRTLYDNAIVSGNVVKHHLDRHPELLTLMDSPLTAAHMLEALQVESKKHHFTNLHQILDTFFSILWPTLCPMNQAHTSSLHRFCQDIAIRMIIYNQDKVHIQQEPADDWAPIRPDYCDFIQIHDNDSMLYEVIDGFVFQTTGECGEFKIRSLIAYFATNFLLESSQNDFKILWRMQQAGVKIPPTIFRNTRLFPHLQPAIKILRPLSPSIDGKPMHYQTLAVHFGMLNDPSIACSQSHISELDLRQCMLHSAELKKCRIGRMNLSNCHVSKMAIVETEIDDLRLGTNVVPFPSSFAHITYSSFHQQFVACNESGICLFFPERGKMHTVASKPGSSITSIVSMRSSGQVCVGTNQGSIYAVPFQTFEEDTISIIAIKTRGMPIRKLWHNEINDHLISYHVDLDSMKTQIELWEATYQHIETMPLPLNEEVNDLIPLNKAQCLLLTHSGQCYLLEASTCTRIDALSRQSLAQILPHHNHSMMIGLNEGGTIILINYDPPGFECRSIDTPQCTHMASLDETRLLCITKDRLVIVVDTTSSSVITTHDSALPRYPNREEVEILCGMQSMQVARVNDGHMQIWDGRELLDHNQIHPPPRRISAITTHPNQPQCAIQFGDDEIEIYSINPFALCWKYRSAEEILGVYFSTEDAQYMMIRCKNEFLTWNYVNNDITRIGISIDEIAPFTRLTATQFSYRVAEQWYQYKGDHSEPTDTISQSPFRIADDHAQHVDGHLYRWFFHDEAYSQMALCNGKIITSGKAIYSIATIASNSDESITAMGFTNGLIWCFQTSDIQSGRCVDTEFAHIRELHLSHGHLIAADSSGRLVIYQQCGTEWQPSHQSIPRPYFHVQSSEQTTLNRLARHTFEFFEKRQIRANDIESALKECFKHSCAQPINP